jgi:hypothetical protein
MEHNPNHRDSDEACDGPGVVLEAARQAAIAAGEVFGRKPVTYSATSPGTYPVGERGRLIERQPPVPGRGGCSFTGQDLPTRALVLQPSSNFSTSRSTRLFVDAAGATGAKVEKYYRDGHIRESAEYCESDVLNTYRVWLRHELLRGRLSDAEFQASEANLIEFVRVRSNTKPHLPI